MMGESKVSVGGAVGYALSLFVAHWRAIWGVLALNALASVVTAAGRLSGNDALLLAGTAMGVILGLMLQGAVFRLALADRHANDASLQPGQAGLQWRGVEWRMLGAALLAGFAFLFLAFLLAMAATAVLFAVFNAQGIDPAATFKLPVDMSKLDPRARLPLSLAQLAVMVPLFYVALRLTLALPASADRGKVQVFATWRWTRGQVVRILMAHLLVILPFLLLNGAITGAALQDGGLSSAAALAVALAVGVPIGGVMAPLSAGIAAYFYRSLAPAAPAGGA